MRRVAVRLALAPGGRCRRRAPRLGAEDTKPPVVIWPTLTPAGDAPERRVRCTSRSRGTDKDAFARAQELDATLRDAVQDLGFTCTWPTPGPRRGTRATRTSSSARPGRAEAGTPEDGHVGRQPARRGRERRRLRRAHRRRAARRARAARPRRDGAGRLGERAGPGHAARPALADDGRPGRARAGARARRRGASAQGIMHAAAVAGARGARGERGRSSAGSPRYSLQRASGSDDPRVLYPLLALGTGHRRRRGAPRGRRVGRDDRRRLVSLGGGWWGAASAFLLAAGHQRAADRRPLRVGRRRRPHRRERSRRSR